MTTLAGSPPLDIIVRTSGVKRLSDFFLWQVGYKLSESAVSLLMCSSSSQAKTCKSSSVLRIGQILAFLILYPSSLIINERCGHCEGPSHRSYLFATDDPRRSIFTLGCSDILSKDYHRKV